MLETKPHIVSKKLTNAIDLLERVKDILDEVYGDDHAVAREMHDDIEHLSDILMGDVMTANTAHERLLEEADRAARAAGGRFRLDL